MYPIVSKLMPVRLNPVSSTCVLNEYKVTFRSSGLFYIINCIIIATTNAGNIPLYNGPLLLWRLSTSSILGNPVDLVLDEHLFLFGLALRN